MAALFPLAALTLLATASISGPAALLFRTIRRVIHPAPAPRAEIAPEDVTAGASSFIAPFARVFASIFASLHLQPQPAVLLPVFHDQDDSAVLGNLHGPSVSTLNEGNTLVNAEPPKVDVVEAEYISATGEVEVEEELDGDAIEIRIVPPPHTRRPTQRLTSPRRAYVDFTIGWDDVWPERQPGMPSRHVKYTYNSYLNAYTCSFLQNPVFRPSTPSSDSTTDSDIEPAALELAAQSADDDLIWALQSLSITDTAPPNESPPYSAFPPAGMSPFCPPPLPTSGPPQPSMTWRLEWY
ncbi:hypothetical protein DFH09DRAFT_1139077 [Mycena vulgaris]|nr:hypothetical protein DFH09DRAFT_1139077 [Mycena vulgaris]